MVYRNLNITLKQIQYYIKINFILKVKKKMEGHNIFIGSPSDVQKEREIIEGIINEMNGYYEHFDVPKLNLISLKTDVRSKIGNLEGQNVIDKQINGKYNVFIGILWKKFGTKTENYDSGTEQEFYNAFSKYEENPKSMEIMFYFCERTPKFSEIDGEQLALVQKFRKKLEDKKGLYKTYSSIEEFEEIIKNDLKLLVTEKNIDFEESSENEEFEEENDGLIDLMEEFEENFNDATLEMEYLTVDIHKSEKELNILNEQNKDNSNRDIVKKYFNTVSMPITELAENVDTRGNTIVNSLNEGIETFNSIIDIHGNFILNNEEIEKTEKSMNECYNSIEELNVAIIDVLNIIRPIQPITTKFSRSKKKLEKSLNTFLRRLVAIQKVIDESNNHLLEYKK